MIEFPTPTAGTVVVRDDKTGHLIYRPKDSRGVVLKVGQHVAFNRSGDVCAGIIVYVGKAIQIDCDPEFQSTYLTSNISRVRNSRSILVLEEI